MKGRGFTLIESLLVIAIIGILASIAAYAITSAQKTSRDTRRKADLTAISLGFQTHFQDRTCADGQTYPGSSLGANQKWLAVKTLAGYQDTCGAFSQYLSRIPTDPTFEKNLPTDQPYMFNLPAPTETPTHFRLSARMEKGFSSQTSQDCSTMQTTWVQTFKGTVFPTNCLDPN
jgi:prepilin-type N-terminal cleavage/methylation domain-containing protein